jgi:hypothetical protein
MLKFGQILKLTEGYNSSQATANTYINKAEEARKTKNIWDKEEIDNIVKATLLRGMGLDKTFYFNYSPEENSSQNGKTNAWLSNLMIHIKKNLKDIAPNPEVFTLIRDTFIEHLRTN